MAMPASGALSFSAIQTEFGGSNPIGLSEYYRNGSYVGGGAPNVPTSGAIALNTFYSAEAATVINITSNTSNYNILTQATAAGYDAAADTTPIIVNVASGVTVSASGTYAMRTGVLNASSSLTVNITGSIDGYTGATAASGAGAAGSVGGDALYWETNGTAVVNVLSGGNLRSGGGGGGGGGRAGAGQRSENKDICTGAIYYGSVGAAGAAGGFGAVGATGASGSYAAFTLGQCITQTAGGGGAGGAAGFALRKNGKTVTLNNSGTVAGSVG
jgi:hypothetical protein